MEEEKKEEELKAEEKQEDTVEPEPAQEAEVEEKAEEVVEKEEKVAEEVAEAEGEKLPTPVEEELPAPTGEEEAEAPAREEKKEKEEEEFVEERVYTIPLSKAWIMPPRKRVPKAMRILKAFVKKHMKLEARGEEEEEETPKRLIVTNEVNEKIWGRGIEKPPRKIRVRAAKDKEGNVTVFLAEGD